MHFIMRTRYTNAYQSVAFARSQESHVGMLVQAETELPPDHPDYLLKLYCSSTSTPGPCSDRLQLHMSVRFTYRKYSQGSIICSLSETNSIIGCV